MKVVGTVLPVIMCIVVYGGECRSPGGQNRASDPLDLQLETIVSHPGVLGTKTWILYKGKGLLRKGSWDLDFCVG